MDKGHDLILLKSNLTSLPFLCTTDNSQPIFKIIPHKCLIYPQITLFPLHSFSQCPYNHFYYHLKCLKCLLCSKINMVCTIQPGLILPEPYLLCMLPLHHYLQNHYEIHRHFHHMLHFLLMSKIHLDI